MLAYNFRPPGVQMACSITHYPTDNNIIGVGMQDGSVRIYNVQRDASLFRLDKHQKRVTSVLFSASGSVRPRDTPISTHARACTHARTHARTGLLVS